VKITKFKSLVVLSLILAFTIFISADSVAASKIFITIGTGSMGGSYYPVGASMSKIINDNVEGVNASVQSTGGTVANLQLIKSDEAQMATVDLNAHDAYWGIGKYKEDKMPWIRALTPMYAECIHLMVAKNSDIKSVYDFRGKKISVGAVASGTETSAKQLLAALGMTFDDIKPRRLGISATTQAFKDRQIDAAIMAGSLGMSGVIEAFSLHLVRLIPMPDEILDKLQKEHPYWVPVVVPAGYYSGQTEEVQQYGDWNYTIIHKDIPEDIVYNITKALFENREKLIETKEKMSEMKPENITYISIPLHPGAKRYYIEKGYEKYINIQ
jgi:TRAP transporter TAXI family solute receptor